MNDVLGLIFGSSHRVKLMKLFVENSKFIFAKKELEEKSKIPKSKIKRELNLLKKVKFLKEGSTKYEGRNVKGWYINEQFTFLYPLTKLILSDKSFSKSTMRKRFKNVGRVKLIIVAGTFLKRDDSRADLLIVGDSLRISKIDSIIRALEADMGRELEYAIVETSDFLYRLDAYDKFVRDILDYPHEVLLDKIGIE